MGSPKTEITFEPPSTTVEVYGVAEATLRLAPLRQGNPFKLLQAHAELDGPDGERRSIDGFCDASDGSLVRFRFMPLTVGPHRFALRLWLGSEERQWSGGFSAVDGGCKGMLRAVGWHFQWSRSGEPFFWNATTAYMMPGLAEERIVEAIDRLARHGVNRIRVSICPSRQSSGARWYEPKVVEREDFTFCYGPWIAGNPRDPMDPRYDVATFDVGYWRKLDLLVAHARSKDMIVQAILFMDGQEAQNYPFDRARSGDDPDELRYVDYAVARLAAFSNIEWCVTNEWALYRPDEWVETIGSHLASRDPYGHTTSVHGHGHFPFRSSPWCSHALFQSWDEHGAHAFMLENRREQSRTGRAIPQVNEEFGYEDNYAEWGEKRRAPSRMAETRCRLAWEIAFSGCYSTVGESAASGLGGWINGLGDESTTMLEGLGRMRSFFEGFAWQKTEPSDELVSGHAYCLAEIGEQYAIYVYGGGCSSLALPDEGPWDIEGFDPATGDWATYASGSLLHSDEPASGPRWASPHVPFGATRAFLIRRPGTKQQSVKR